jgi:hypothetical protein
MAACRQDLLIEQGRTFALRVHWETDPLAYREITNIERSAPARLTVPGHGVPDGWRGAVTGVKGMFEINAEANRVRECDYRALTVIDADTLEINEVNAARFHPYLSGGHLQYLTPMSLAGFTARMQIRERPGGALLASSEAADAPLDIVQLAIDPAAASITLTIAAAHTEGIAWRRGVYDLEMVSPDAEPVVTRLLSGAVTVCREVTT